MKFINLIEDNYDQPRSEKMLHFSPSGEFFFDLKAHKGI